MKNKVLLISLVFILISCLFINNNVFATETTNTLIVDGYDFSDVYNYFSVDDAFYIINVHGQGDYYISVPNDNYFKAYNMIRTADGSAVYCNPYFEEIGGNSYNHYMFNKNTLKFEYSFKGGMPVWPPTAETVIYTNKGIYNSDKTSFFLNPPAPPEPELTQTQKLGEIMKAAGTQATTEVVQIILIVIATTAGLIILLIGLKKGLTALMSGFRH